MTYFTRIAAAAAIATGVSLGAGDANASELGHIVIDSGDCKEAAAGAYGSGTDAINISLYCEQSGGAVEISWENPGGDTSFEVSAMVATADGQWHLDEQFTVYDSKIVGDVAGDGLFGIFVRGNDTGFIADGGTVLRYRASANTPSQDNNDDAAGTGDGTQNVDEVDNDDKDAAGNDSNSEPPATSEAELIEQLLNLISDLEDEIGKLKQELEDRDEAIDELEGEVEKLKSIIGTLR